MNLLLSFLLIFGFAGHAAETARSPREQLDHELFLSIESAAQRFIKKYPPEKYYYLGLGRSPHGLLAYIDAAGLGSVRYVPMSNAKWHFESPEGLNLRTPERERATKDHFKKFIPSDEELAGRKILVVDHCDTSSGLMVGMYYVIESIFEDGRDVGLIRGVGLHKAESTSGHYYRNKDKRETVIVRVDKFSTYSASERSSRLYGDMMYGKDDSWITYYAPVGRFDMQTLEKGPNYAEERPQYQELLQWLREKIVARSAGCTAQLRKKAHKMRANLRS